MFYAFVKSVQELTALQLLFDDAFENIEQGYDAAYFEENILILYYNVEGSGGNTNWVHNIEIDGEDLVLNVFRHTQGMTCDIGTWAWEISVARSDISTTTREALILTSVYAAPDSITVYVKDEYVHKVRDESFTITDFNHPNIASVEYHYYNFQNINVEMGLIVIKLNEIGTTRAQEMLEYFRKLPFVL